MNSSDTRVSTYLDDLARMLADLDPATRDDVLAGVREHLDATLAERGDDPAVVDAALLRLGPPEQVAAAARADLPPANPSARPATSPAGRHPGSARLAALVAVAVVALPTAIALLSRVGSELSGSGMTLGLHPSEALMLLLPTFPVWALAVVVALLGHDLTGRTKAWLVVLGPAMSASVLATAALPDPRSLGTVVSLPLLTGVAAGIVHTGRQVWRESWAQPFARATT